MTTAIEEERLCKLERQLDVAVERIDQLNRTIAGMSTDIKLVTLTLSQHRGRDTVVVALLSILATIAGGMIVHSRIFGG